jgi:hypothetical protein
VDDLLLAQADLLLTPQHDAIACERREKMSSKPLVRRQHACNVIRASTWMHVSYVSVSVPAPAASWSPAAEPFAGRPSDELSGATLAPGPGPALPSASVLLQQQMMLQQQIQALQVNAGAFEGGHKPAAAVKWRRRRRSRWRTHGALKQCSAAWP